MSEFLDIYDENGKHVGVEDRKIVHAQGLWHKTVHLWLFDKLGNIYFQQRASSLKDNPSKLYTTASGHLSAGESLIEALNREIGEELGLELDTVNAKLVDEIIYKGDFLKTDGSKFIDRVFVNIFILEFKGNLLDFDFQIEEIDGIFKLPIKDVLNLFKNEINEVKGQAVVKENGQNKITDVNLKLSDFLFLESETAYSKYGKVLQNVLDVLEG